MGDIFLLTTDGVHDVITGQDVQEALDGTVNLDGAAEKIVQVALARGSNDNLTVQILRTE